MAKEHDFEDCFTVAGDLQEFAAIIDKCVEWLREEPLTDKQEAAARCLYIIAENVGMLSGILDEIGRRDTDD